MISNGAVQLFFEDSNQSCQGAAAIYHSFVFINREMELMIMCRNGGTISDRMMYLCDVVTLTHWQFFYEKLTNIETFFL